MAPPNEHDGCRTYYTAQTDDMAALAAAGTPAAVLLSDGGCSLTHKLRLALANGAVALLLTLRAPLNGTHSTVDLTCPVAEGDGSTTTLPVLGLLPPAAARLRVSLAANGTRLRERR